MSTNENAYHKTMFCKRRTLLVCLLLVIAILAVYWQVKNHQFINFDDTIYVTNNSFVKSGLTQKSVAWSFGFEHRGGAYWQPLTWLSHMLDYQLYGLWAGGHHLTNLIFHLVNTVLLFLILNTMTGDLLMSAFVAALFGLHPVNVEAVAWVSSRKTVLSTLFWMLAMTAYVYYTKRPSLHRYLLTFFVFTLGLMSKPMLVTLPFIFLLLDYWPLGRLRFKHLDSGDNEKKDQVKIFGHYALPELGLILEKLPLLALSLISSRLTLLSLQPYGNVLPLKLVPLSLRISNAVVSYINYIKKMIWPNNLTVLYSFPETIPLWQSFGAGLLLTCISVLVLRVIRSKPYFTVGWLWYLGTLVPVIGLVQGGLWPAMADRFAYVPYIGLFIMIAWGIRDFIAGKRFGKIACALLSVILLTALMVSSWLQVGCWQNSMTLFTHAIHLNPDSAIAHFQLGRALEDSGRLDGAIVHYDKVLKIDPKYAPAYTNLGAILERKGNKKKAMAHYYKALTINPYDAGAYNNMGNILAGLGRIREATLAYRQALRLQPDMLQSLYNLTWIAAAHSNKDFRNGEEAVRLAERLCRITNYNQPLYIDALAAAYAEAGRFAQAVNTAQIGFDMVLKSGPQELAQDILKRLTLYQKGKSYRMKPTP